MSKKKQEIQKIIDNKQTFADYAYKEYRSENFGMTSCCASQLDKYSRDNELCDWQEGEKTIYNIDTTKFTEWNWMGWLTGPNPVEAPEWVQRRREKYSQRRLYGMNSAYLEHHEYSNDNIDHSYNWGFVDSTATTAGNMTCLIKANVFDNATAAVIRGTSRVYAVCMKDKTTAAQIFNFGGTPSFRDNFIELLWNTQPQPSGWFECPTTSCGSIAMRIQRAWCEYLWWKLDWIILNPGGDLVPASGDLTVTMKENDGGQNKNGANKNDFVFFLLVTAGALPGQIQTCNNIPAYEPFTGVFNGPNSKIVLLSAGTGASRFSVRVNGDLDGCQFVPGETGGIGTGYGADYGYAMWEQNNESIIGMQYNQNTGVNIGVRAMVSYANVDITSVGWCSPVMNDCDELAPNVYCLDYNDPNTCYTNRADYRTCVDDAELLYITVKDKNAVSVKDYDIFIDNTHYGKTNTSGVLIVNIKHASKDTKHVINGCTCFTTTGGCNQQKIDIVLKEEVKPVCTNLAIDCL
tara:strand:- start:4937 stop:6493 length:1557 start_codon:yes stop_codon:yes gene_type:complete